MYKFLISITFLLTSLVLGAQVPLKNTVVHIETSLGTMKAILYEDTQLHKENFLKLVSSGYYNGLLFHRIITDFMIQTGDPNSRYAKKNQQLGSGGPGYTIPAEFRSQYFHKKGALAAARLGDQVNPRRESSGSQFYIVQGRVFTTQELDMMVTRGMHNKFTDEQIASYTTIGGAPHLDYSYTVFGEITEGLDIIDKLASVQRDANDRPLEDIKIIKITVE